MTDNNQKNYKVGEEEERKRNSIEYDASIVTNQHVAPTAERSKYNAKTMRKKYDDVEKRKEFKDAQFGDKKTVKDPYTGETLHKDTAAAKRKYGKAKYNEHTFQTDHTVSIEKTYKRNRDNVFLQDDDIKKIANIEKNYKGINGHLNQSKGSKSNFKVAKDNELNLTQTAKMVKAQWEAELHVSAETIKLTAERAHEVGTNAAMSGATIGAGISLANNIKMLATGEEDGIDAVLNVAIDTAKSGAQSYGGAVATKAAEGCIKKAGHSIAEFTEKKAVEEIGASIGKGLVTFAESNNIGKAVSIIKEVGQSTLRYIDGEISAEEYVLELGEKGTGLAMSFACGAEGVAIGGAAGGIIGGLIGSVIPGAGTAAGAAVGAKCGAVVGEIIGNLVGYMIGTEVYRVVFESNNGPLEIEMRTMALKTLSMQLDQYNAILEKNILELNLEHEQRIFVSFQNIHDAILRNDVKEINNSLQSLCKEFDLEIAFKSREELVEFMKDDNSYITI